MAGRPGRSGGWNKLSVAEHVLRGTHNVTRHGPRPAVVVTAAVRRTVPVPATVSAGLTARGLTFVEDCWATYDGWTPASLVLLREAGYLLEQLEALRGTDGERVAQRLLLTTLTALRLE